MPVYERFLRISAWWCFCQELADALDSDSGGRKAVGVQVPSSAPLKVSTL